MPDPFLMAVKFESLGRSVVPLGKAGDPKRPHIRWREYQHKTPEPDDLLEWQEQYSPTNWATVCGEVSNVTVVDCDTREASEYCTSYGLEPAVSSPHGLHFYVACEGAAIRTSNLDMEGIPLEVKGNGSLATFCGPGYEVKDRALHPDGVYRLAELPDGLRIAIMSRKPKRLSRELPDALYEGERNKSLFRLASGLRGRGMSHDVILAALQSENQARCKPPLPEREIRAIAGSASEYAAAVSIEEIVTGLSRFSLPSSALRIFMVVLGNTTLRGKPSDWASYSQLEQATGLVHREIARGLRYLKEASMIDVTLKGQARFYRPKSPATWKPAVGQCQNQ